MSAVAEGDHIDWKPVLARGAEIVRSYRTPVTLRQLFYRLVAAGFIPNSVQPYKRLSALTADARREDTFPSLADNTRHIIRFKHWTSPRDAVLSAARRYTRDHAEGQSVALYLATEKATLVAQLESWFSDLDFPIVALRGYSSEAYEREIAADISTYAKSRPVIVLYSGDHDPSGWDIERNFTEQLQHRGVKFSLERVALDPKQCKRFGLPQSIGKEKDSRAGDFVKRFGSLVQVEVEALDPEQLRALYQDAIDEHWEPLTYKKVLKREARERSRLMKVAENFK